MTTTTNTRVCKQCGEDFEPVNNRQIYCSKKCKFKRQNQKRKDETREKRAKLKQACAWCGEDFKPVEKNQIYCSIKCQKERKNQKIKDERREARAKKLVKRTCLWCGNPIPIEKQARAKYCSVKCKKKHQKQKGDSERRAMGIKPQKIYPIGSKRTVIRDYVDIKTTNGWQREHRYVMEQHLGRPLTKNEHVHHKNGIRHDNTLDNLELMLTHEHPPGQRVQDKLAYAKKIIDGYGALFGIEVKKSTRTKPKFKNTLF